MVIDTYKYKGNDQYPSTMIEEHSHVKFRKVYQNNTNRDLGLQMDDAIRHRGEAYRYLNKNYGEKFFL